MELLIIGGLIAVVVLFALAVVFLLQQRRSGTVKAVVGPRHGSPAPPPAIDEHEADAGESEDER
jgi:hypothetical protein